MTDLDRAIESLPRAYAGPGGAVAVIKDGTVAVRHSWGWAHAERRIPFTPKTLFRMCSITKQFTCGLVLDTCADPADLDSAIAARLPRLTQPPPTALHLCHNQSGLRDYWAAAMLHGSPVEAPFGETEARRVIAGTKTLHFEPGTRFSYVNQNFRILSDCLEERTGRSFAELLRHRIFDRAGMETAFLAADTSAMPDGTTGYEGAAGPGFRAAENRILWTGDAGLGASLDDMIAWERFIDATRDDPGSLYRRLSADVSFADGHAATYGFGLGRSTAFGRALTGHGGALRGWRAHRLYVPSERLSIVVMFNHFGDAHGAAMAVLRAALGEPAVRPLIEGPPPNYAGAYLEPETGLSVRIDAGFPGSVRLRFGHSAEVLTVQGDGSASAASGTRLRPEPDGLWMDRPAENQSSRLRPLPAAIRGNVAGHYHCAELDAAITVEDTGGVLYGAFSGFLGQGRMELLDPIGTDVWALPCPRGLDHTPPGDWTLVFRRDGAGTAVAVEVGCWLARRLVYERTA